MLELTQELVRSLLTYRNGNLYWKVKKASQIKIGNKAGSIESDGYYRITINRKRYNLHRLIFLYHNGYLPKFIDHIDRDKSNNNIRNLREITLSQNQWNRKQNKNTSSKYKGVYLHKPPNKWLSRIGINGTRIYLGYFKNEIDAAKAYNKKAIEIFGKYANLNNVGNNYE